MTEPEPLYQERRRSWGITFILGASTLLLTAVLIAQCVYGPLGTKPAPTWFLATLVGLFALLTLIFRQITLTLIEDKVEVRYGIFSTARRWEHLIACEEDEQNAFYGWGIRFGRYKHNWVWVYNVMGGPRVAFLTGKRKPKGLIVSTTNPGDVIRIANAQIRAAERRSSK